MQQTKENERHGYDAKANEKKKTKLHTATTKIALFYNHKQYESSK